jgi:hypothetical protein
MVGHARCYNPKNKSFKRYGGRGISVCRRWRKFENFLADMGEKPSDGNIYDIHRINNDGDYTPDNCQWLEHSLHMKLHGKLNHLRQAA